MKTLTILHSLVLLCFVALGSTTDLKITANVRHNGYIAVPHPGGGFLMISYLAGTVSLVNPQGQTQWAKALDSVDTYVLMDAVLSPDTSINLVFKRSSITPGTDFRVVKLDATGQLLFHKSFSMAFTPGITYNSLLKANGDGGVTFTPSTRNRMSAIRLNADGSIALAQTIAVDSTQNTTYASTDAVNTGDGGVIIVGGTNAGSVITGPVVARISPNGILDWVIRFNDSTTDSYATAVAAANDGNYLVCGIFGAANTNTQGGFIMKITPQGSILWRRKFVPGVGGYKNVTFERMEENADGTLVLIGTGELNTGYVRALVSLSATGELMASRGISLASNLGSMARLYKTSEEVILGDMYYNVQDSINTDVLIKLPLAAGHCVAVDFVVAEKDTSRLIAKPTNMFASQAMEAPVNLAGGTHDTTLAFTSRNLCTTTALADVETSSIQFSITPNPVLAGGAVTLNVAANTAIGQMQLYDVSGKLVKQVPTVGSGTIVLNTTGLNAGVYLVHLLTREGENAAVKKLIVVNN